MEVFVVIWDDDYNELDAVFSTPEKAKNYVKSQYERCDLGKITWEEQFDPDYIHFNDGYIQKHEVDILPFLEDEE